MTLPSLSFTAAAPPVFAIDARQGKENAELQKKDKTADKWVVTFWMRSTLHLLLKLMDRETSNRLYDGSALLFSTVLRVFLFLPTVLIGDDCARFAFRRKSHGLSVIEALHNMGFVSLGEPQPSCKH